MVPTFLTFGQRWVEEKKKKKKKKEEEEEEEETTVLAQIFIARQA